MDPNANLEQQLEIAHAYADGDIEMGADTAAKLSELIVSLHEWIVSGGFLPEQWGATDIAQSDGTFSSRAQGIELARRMKRGTWATVAVHPFDLPANYWQVRFSDGFECGIAPDGSVSS